MDRGAGQSIQWGRIQGRKGFPKQRASSVEHYQENTEDNTEVCTGLMMQVIFKPAALHLAYAAYPIYMLQIPSANINFCI